MKNIIFILLFFIFSPSLVFPAQIDDILGYWKSENKDPLNQYKVMEISKNFIKDGGKKPQDIIVEKENSSMIIKFSEYKKISNEMYDKLYYKITPINKDKIILDYPTAGGTRNEWIYNRITGEDAQKYINTPIKLGNLKPTEDPGF